MYFSNLNIIWLLIYIFLLILIIYLFYINYKKQLLIINTFKKLNLTRYFYIKYIFLLLSFFVLLLSIFWIKYNDDIINDRKYWIDIVFVLDVSKSMNVADIINKNWVYTRLEFAKNSIEEFVIKNPNNRYWLIIFSWDAVSSVPLTIDKDIFLNVLKNVDYRNLLSWWTNFSKAFELWINRLLFSDDSSKALIFLSDWWEDSDLDEKILKNLNSYKNIRYFIWWIWTSNWWKIIVWKDIYGKYSYQKYEGEYVISKLNENNLEKISDIFNTNYFIFDNSSDINKFSNRLNIIQTKIIEQNYISRMLDFSRYLTIISFIFFITYIFLYLFEDKIYFFKNKTWLKK